MKRSEKKANDETEYGPNNPEPIFLKESASPEEKDDALHAAIEYINGKKA